MRRLLLAVALGALLAGCADADADADGSGGAAPSTPVTEVFAALEPCPQQPDDPSAGDETMPASSVRKCSSMRPIVSASNRSVSYPSVPPRVSPISSINKVRSNLADSSLLSV